MKVPALAPTLLFGLGLAALRLAQHKSLKIKKLRTICIIVLFYSNDD
jgi:hypothetical protein